MRACVCYMGCSWKVRASFSQAVVAAALGLICFCLLPGCPTFNKQIKEPSSNWSEDVPQLLCEYSCGGQSRGAEPSEWRNGVQSGSLREKTFRVRGDLLSPAVTRV